MVTKFSEEQRLAAVKFYQEGNTVVEVENLTGISANYIKNLLKKYNILARPSGFQQGNSSRKGLPHSIETKNKISVKHKLSGHKPSKEAIVNGQPKTLIKRWMNHKKDAVSYFIMIYKKGARDRNLLFNLPREDIEKLIIQNCYYCGALPSERNVASRCKLICNGIDRVDNNLGYFVENCVSSCKICNKMKSNMSEQDFLNHCCRVANHFTRKLVKVVNE
jgi:hypothetical protein